MLAYHYAYPRRFVLMRLQDASGVSGTGRVATGVQFPDGKVCMRWNTTTASTALYDSMSELEHIHGHGGATRVEWIDQISDQWWCSVCDQPLGDGSVVPCGHEGSMTAPKGRDAEE